MNSSVRDFTVFEASSDMGHFRRQYTTTTALTYPMPPRTALCGLVGAILGLPKNESLAELTDNQAVFGIEALTTTSYASFSLNLIDTKGNRSFRPKLENPHTQVRYEVIRSPKYRVYFSHPKLGAELADRISNGLSVYTPCFGLAWMIAWLDQQVRIQRAELSVPEIATSYSTLIRTADLVGDVEWDAQAIYHRLRMPAEMQPDRLVTRYEEYLLETNLRGIRAKLQSHWQSDDGTCFSAM